MCSVDMLSLSEAFSVFLVSGIFIFGNVASISILQTSFAT